MVALKPLLRCDGLFENRFDVDAIHHLIAGNNADVDALDLHLHFQAVKSFA